MIPLRNASRRPRAVPIITWLIILANAGAFLLELLFGDRLVNAFAMRPALIMRGQGWLTLFTSMFLHAGWAHIIGNMVFFGVFGPQIEDAMGALRYLVFYVLTGLAASAAQIALNPNSVIPVLGASGAVAGVMGAFLLLFPGDRIVTLIFLGYWIRAVQLPALILIGFWFVTQLFNGLGTIASVRAQTGGVAYFAHIGGFVAGLLLAKLFERRRPRIGYYWRDF